MKEVEKPWIEVGYQIFANDGPSALKIEQVARQVGKNKSSFYHLFADQEVFEERLLSYHLDQAKNIALKESKASNEQELITILVTHKTDLLFNRQLRFHRNKDNFESCFNKTNEIALPAILPLWKEIIGLPENSALAQMVFALTLENFYLQITQETLNEAWIKQYLIEIRQMVKQFKAS